MRFNLGETMKRFFAAIACALCAGAHAQPRLDPMDPQEPSALAAACPPQELRKAMEFAETLPEYAEFIAFAPAYYFGARDPSSSEDDRYRLALAFEARRAAYHAKLDAAPGAASAACSAKLQTLDTLLQLKLSAKFKTLPSTGPAAEEIRNYAKAGRAAAAGASIPAECPDAQIAQIQSRPELAAQSAALARYYKNLAVFYSALDESQAKELSGSVADFERDAAKAKALVFSLRPACALDYSASLRQTQTELEARAQRISPEEAENARAVFRKILQQAN